MGRQGSSFRSAFTPWLWAYAGSLLLALALVVPVVLAIGDYRETLTPRTVEMVWNRVDPRAEFPADDSALHAWFREQDPALKVKVERSTLEGGGTRVLVRWRGRVEQGAVPLRDLGYISPNELGRSSAKTVYKVRARDVALLAFTCASLGYLGFGVWYWRRRQPRPVSSTLKGGAVKGVALGSVCFALGCLGFLAGTLGGSPHLLGWPVAMLSGGTLVKCLVTLVGVFLVPTAWELFFRQGLYARAAAAGHERRAALVSSALFALPLVLTPVASCVLFLHGLACCYVYRTTGRLFASWILSVTAVALAFVLAWALPGSLVTVTWR